MNMSDIYLNDKGQVSFIDPTPTGQIPRRFKPVAFFGQITVYEEEWSVNASQNKQTPDASEY